MPATDHLQAAIHAYFDGQRRAAIVGGAASLLIIALALVAILYGGAFQRGLGVTVGITALLIGGSGASLAVRDDRGLATLLECQPETIVAETARMTTVVRNYRYYRAAFALIGAVGVVMLIVRFAPLVDGIAVGLLLLAALGLAIDHFDRKAATTYLDALTDFGQSAFS